MRVLQHSIITNNIILWKNNLHIILYHITLLKYKLKSFLYYSNFMI